MGCPSVRARATLNNNNIDSGCNKAELKRWILKIFFVLPAQLLPALSGEERERGLQGGFLGMDRSAN